MSSTFVENQNFSKLQVSVLDLILQNDSIRFEHLMLWLIYHTQCTCLKRYLHHTYILSYPAALSLFKFR